MKELARMGESRQATVSEEVFLIYSEELLPLDPQDVTTGLRELGRRPRAQYETALPDLGTVLGAVQRAKKERTKFVRIPFGKRFVECDRYKHFLRGRIYVDPQGKPCADDFPGRALRDCECLTTWYREHDEHSQAEDKRKQKHWEEHSGYRVFSDEEVSEMWERDFGQRSLRSL